jgi:hypothetical protein
MQFFRYDKGVPENGPGSIRQMRHWRDQCLIWVEVVAPLARLVADWRFASAGEQADPEQDRVWEI